MAKRRKRFVLYIPDRCADLGDWLSAQPNRSEVVIMALEAWRARCGDAPESTATLDYERLRAMFREELSQVAVIKGGTPAREGHEDDDVAQGMTTLIGQFEPEEQEEDGNDLSD